MSNDQTYFSSSVPVYMIGAGGIVNSAHLPAYNIAGYKVEAIVDLDYNKAIETAKKFQVPNVFHSVDEMLQHLPEKVVFDVAVPGAEIIGILEQLPEDSVVLLQKPMGENLSAAKKILELTRKKNITAAVNFQLRYAPYILEVKRMMDDGLLGEINDVEINVNVYTPWKLWDFLFTSPRVEILYHSIHYVDLVRNLLGNPVSVYAKTTKHASMPQLASVRSNIIMDYGDMIRANILTNHCHEYGTAKQQSYIKIEGSKGAVLINFGALINYPHGTADKFEYVLLEDGKEPVWNEKKIEGSWFPHAFAGSMEQVMLKAEDIISSPDNSVEDCIYTMACVEAAYKSSEAGGVALTDFI